MKKLRITVDGKAFDVSVEILDGGTVPYVPAPAAAAPVATVPVAAPTPAPVATAPAGAGAVPSPLAGRVVSLEAKVGQPIKEGDRLLVLEAMKMNTDVYAPSSGTLTSFEVKEGDPVQEGQTLAIIA